MSKYISINNEVDVFLSNEVNKDENGQREETWSTQLKRLLKINEGK